MATDRIASAVQRLVDGVVLAVWLLSVSFWNGLSLLFTQPRELGRRTVQGARTFPTFLTVLPGVVGRKVARTYRESQKAARERASSVRDRGRGGKNR